MTQSLIRRIERLERLEQHQPGGTDGAEIPAADFCRAGRWLEQVQALGMTAEQALANGEPPLEGVGPELFQAVIAADRELRESTSAAARAPALPPTGKAPACD